MADKFSAGTVWQFPTSAGDEMYLKVILKLEDLQLPEDSSMTFVADGYLVSVSKRRELSKNMFGEEDVLVRGMFLQKSGHWGRHGFRKVDDRANSESDLDFPVWYQVSSDLATLEQTNWYRGEFALGQYQITRQQIEKTWGSMLLPRCPPREFVTCFADFEAKDWFRNSDGRYCDARKELCETLQLDFTTPYIELLPKDRKEIYRSAAGIA